MKKFVFYVMMCAVMMASFTSCNEETGGNNENNNNDPLAVVIHTGVIAETKAYDTTWEAGDEIGVTEYNPDYTEILEDKFNCEYITEANLSIFHAVDLDETIFFPLDGSDMALKAYYPYMANLPQNMIVHWNVQDQSDLAAIDLMTAEHVSGFNKEVVLVRLHFYHRLCKLVFLLQTEAETAGVSLADCELTITGMETGNDYDLFNDVFGTNYDGIADITVPRHTAMNEPASERNAIVFPRSAGTGVTFEFATPEGDTYTAEMSDGLELQGGNKYTFIITLAENMPIVTATIEPWINNDYEYLTAH